MCEKIAGYSALLLEGTLSKDKLEAIINKANDLFRGKSGFMQCCSVEGIPSLKFALSAMDNALNEKPLGATKPRKNSLAFLLWLYCTSQLNRAIGQAGKTEKGVLLAIAAEGKDLIERALASAKELGFKEQQGLIEKNFKENIDSFIERFEITEGELRALSHLPRQEAVERLVVERQALMAL